MRKMKDKKVFLTVENIDFYTIKEEKENYQHRLQCRFVKIKAQ